MTGAPGRGDRSKLAALRLSAVGIEFGLGALLGYLLGAWLDRRFDTYPYLTLLMLLFGLAAAFSSMIKRVRDYERQAARDAEDPPGGQSKENE